MEEQYKFEIKDLDLFYGQYQALHKISMNIRANEITALIGPSGCGKSTFLKTLNRMNDLEEGVRIEGDVKLDGVDLYKEMDAIELRKRVGMVFQQPNPFPKSVYENVATVRESTESAANRSWMRSWSEAFVRQPSGMS